MKFSIPANALNEAATFAAQAISKNPVQPVLGGLLISVEADGVHITGSSMEETSRTHVDADVETTGTVLLQARVFTDVLKKLRDRMCTVERDGNAVKLSAGSAHFTLHAMPEDEYPALSAQPAPVGTVDGETFSHAVAMVIEAASTDDTLPLLTGVNVEAVGDTLTFMSTDRYRLAKATINWAPNGMEDFTVLIKGTWLKSVSKNLVGQVEFQHDGNQVGINAGARASFANIKDGDFPKIRTLFPDTWESEAVFDRGLLAEAVDRVATVAERNTPIRLVFEDDTVTLDAGTGEASQGNETIACEWDGPRAAVAFNPGFLGWSISTLQTQKIMMRFTHMSKPALIVPTVGDTQHLVMPIRLPEGA